MPQGLPVLRIVVVGQAAFGEKALERLAASHEIAAVYCPPDRPSSPPDPLKVRAETLRLPVVQRRSFAGDEALREFAAHRADLAVLAYATTILPEALIRLPRFGTICFHPSLLPRYRGGSAINWQIIRGERKGGLTVFWTDAGIDTGPILLQREVEIGPDDTAGSLYYEKIFPLGIDAIEEAVRQIEAGRAPRIPQDETRASYDPLCRDEHVAIDWTRSPREIYDRVRGADPRPGAWARLRGEVVRLYEARLEPGEAPPGRIVAADAGGIRVGLGAATLRVGRLRFGKDGRKAPAAELVAAGRIAVGDRFEAGR